MDRPARKYNKDPPETSVVLEFQRFSMMLLRLLSHFSFATIDVMTLGRLLDYGDSCVFFSRVLVFGK
jgi:hypothetical protein